jgi:hypothetical protein
MFSSPDFKNQFMTTQNVSSKEYNAIVKNVIGIYGQETKFGTRKEAPDWVAKKFPGLVSTVGPFQINPKNLKTQRFSREDLFDPIKGAEAAATFLAENLQLLRLNILNKFIYLSMNIPFEFSIFDLSFFFEKIF